MSKATFRIPQTWRPITGGEKLVTVEAEPPTVGTAIDALYAAYPGIAGRVSGAPGRFAVNIFLGTEQVAPEHLGTTTFEGPAEIDFVPIVAGGDGSSETVTRRFSDRSAQEILDLAAAGDPSVEVLWASHISAALALREIGISIYPFSQAV